MHLDKWRKRSGLLAVSFLLASPLLAQEDAELRQEIEALKRNQQALQLQIQLMRDVEALKSGQESIRKELAEIKNLLRQQGAGAPKQQAAALKPDIRSVVLDLGGRPSRGEETSPLTLVEFTDYQ